VSPVTNAAPPQGGSFRDVRRHFAAATGRATIAVSGITLEAITPSPESPRLYPAELLEDRVLRVRDVPGAPEPGFAAFLDGTQQSRVVHYARGLPVVHGTVAAAIRARAERRLTTWREPLVRSRLYAPKSRLNAEQWALVTSAALAVTDTTERTEADGSQGGHPYELLQRAVHAVQRDREDVEQELAEQWCANEGEPLYIDGSISKSAPVATSPLAVGVVKSHQTLHVDSEALALVLELPAHARTSVFLVGSSRRTPVASWYLRLRDASGHDPMWGLVRIEVAAPTAHGTHPALTTRADIVSRWALAEAAPLALPDARWDRMAYGVRDVEEYLRARG
jgi:hypothetical protein